MLGYFLLNLNSGEIAIIIILLVYIIYVYHISYIYSMFNIGSRNQNTFPSNFYAECEIMCSIVTEIKDKFFESLYGLYRIYIYIYGNMCEY